MTKTTNENTNTALSIFDGGDRFEHFQRVAKALASSDLLPQQFKNNIPNTLIALDIADRIRANPLAVMQSMYLVHNKPAWAATFIIAQVNASGKFSPMRFDIKGTGDAKTCVAWCKETESGERVEGPEASIAMAKAEGWYERNGSKWKTMPDLMLRYRAATFFGRLYCPELLMGMRTEDELGDIIDITTPPPIQAKPDLSPQTVDEVPKSIAPEVAEVGTAKPIEDAAQEPPLKSPQLALSEFLNDAGITQDVFINYLNVNQLDKKAGFETSAYKSIEEWPAEAATKIGTDTALMARAVKRFGKKA